MASNQLKNQHLMWRAGFGPVAGQLEQFKSIDPLQLYSSLKKASSKKPDFLEAADSYLKGLWNGISEENRKEKMAKEDQKNIQQKSRKMSKRKGNPHFVACLVQSLIQ